MNAVWDADGAAVVLAGRYVVGPLVGVGGTAQVYRAFDRVEGYPVAVKVFAFGGAPGPGYGGARELQLLAGVRHPSLVGVHDAGVDPQGCPYVVMDLVDGQSLSMRLNDGPLPVGAVVRLGAALADALAVVHARGVVHRDVKPANVLLDGAEHPWLTDFGIARIVDATRVTATGLVVGTAAYMAPEQVRGVTVGPAADVYALGLVLLEAVTGRREYEGAAIESALARLHRAPEVPATVPDPLATTLRAMTATAADDRPTAAAVAAALGDTADPAVAAGPATDRGARRRAAPVAALATLVAAAVTGVLTLGGTAAPGTGPPTVAVRPAPALGAPLRMPEPDLARALDAALAAQPVPVAVAEPAPGTAAPGTAGPATAAAGRTAAARGGASHDRSAEDRAAAHDDPAADDAAPRDVASDDGGRDDDDQDADAPGHGKAGNSDKAKSDKGNGNGGKGGGRSGGHGGKGKG